MFQSENTKFHYYNFVVLIIFIAMFCHSIQNKTVNYGSEWTSYYVLSYTMRFLILPLARGSYSTFEFERKRKVRTAPWLLKKVS